MEGDETPSEGPGPPGSRPTTAGSGSSAVGSPGASTTAYAPPGSIFVAPARHGSSARSRVIHVLVAEDDEFERAALAELLGQTNEQYASAGTPLQYAVQLVPNGAAVRAAVVAHRELGATTGTRFDLVLLDVVLGVNETAADVVGWVRETAGPTVPIVLFSAGVQLELVRALCLPPRPRATARRADRRPAARAPTPHRPRAAARRAAAASTRLTPHRTTTALVCRCGAASCSAPTRS